MSGDLYDALGMQPLRPLDHLGRALKDSLYRVSLVPEQEEVKGFGDVALVMYPSSERYLGSNRQRHELGDWCQFPEDNIVSEASPGGFIQMLASLQVLAPAPCIDKFLLLQAALELVGLLPCLPLQAVTAVGIIIAGAVAS